MKKTLALALTAAMAISAVGTTAFAAKAVVPSDKSAFEKYMEVRATDNESTGTAVTLSEVKDYKDLPNEDLYKFIGWSKTPQTQALGPTAAAPSDMITKGTPGTSTSHASVGDKLYPVWQYWKDPEEKENAGNSAKDAADKAAKEKAMEDKLKAADETHNATNNYDTGKKFETKQLDAGTATKWDKANQPAATWAEISHDGRVADLGDNDTAFYYQVSTPAGQTLVTGKSARIDFKLPEEYSTDNCDVTVYKIKDWCTKEKVKKADMMLDGQKLHVWTTAPNGRYVVVLSPKGASTGSSDKSNPDTGDFSALPIAMLAVAALGATGFVAYKKRMAE